MSQQVNEFEQPVGEALPTDWSPPSRPPREAIGGRYVRLEPLDAARHADELWKANQHDLRGEGWTYMAYGPFQNEEELRTWVEQANASEDPLYFAYVDISTNQAVGWGSFMRINPPNGVIEVGSIRMSPLLQRTVMATEAMHLMMKQAFALGYRRYEWKCDALNAPSCRAAERLGFIYEGTFRQAMHYKGRNRDTAWYSVIDSEWSAIEQAHIAWLKPENFNADGKQRQSLSDLVSQARQ